MTVASPPPDRLRDVSGAATHVRQDTDTKSRESYALIMQGRREFNRLQHDMKPRDAVISFQCASPGILQVTEMIDGERIHHREFPLDPGIVTEIEERYIFFAKQADIAREQVGLGHSCQFNVYFREP